MSEDEENISRENGVCRCDLTDKFLLILLEPCHRENIKNTYLVSSVTLCLHTILFVYIIVNVCKQSLIRGGGQLLGNDDGVKIPLGSALPVGSIYDI